jgi:hypothetical protein
MPNAFFALSGVSYVGRVVPLRSLSASFFCLEPVMPCAIEGIIELASDKANPIPAAMINCLLQI